MEKFIDDRDSIPKLGSEVISCVITAALFWFFCQPIAMALSMPVDPFAVEDPSELPDWRLPLSFMKSRHIEKIEGDQITEESWRMKDRVRRVRGWSVGLSGRVRRVRGWRVGLGGCMFVGNLQLHDSEGGGAAM